MIIKLCFLLLRLGRRLFGLREEEVVLNGTRIIYSDGGKGEPLVLLHGLGASRSTFDMVASRLIGRYRLVIPDLPGFGESADAPDGDYGIDAQLAWVELLVAHLGLTQFHLGGNSMGGWIAAAYAAKHPDRVLSLWLLGAAGTEEMLESEMVKVRQEQGAYMILVRNMREFDKVMRYIFYSAPPLPLPLRWVGARVSAAKYPLHAKIFDQLLDEGEEHRLEPHLPRIKAPTLLVWGDHDRVVPLPVMQRFEALIPHSETILMKNVGHVPQMEKPKQAARDYLKFRAGLAQ